MKIRAAVLDFFQEGRRTDGQTNETRENGGIFGSKATQHTTDKGWKEEGVTVSDRLPDTTPQENSSKTRL